jgi:hypothetical protein
MTYEPTEAQIEAARAAWLDHDGVLNDRFRAALIAAEKAAWIPAKDAPQDVDGHWSLKGCDLLFEGSLWPDGHVKGFRDDFPLSELHLFRPFPPPPEQST